MKNDVTINLFLSLSPFVSFIVSGLFMGVATIRTTLPYSDPSRSDSAEPAKYLRFSLNGLVKLHVHLGITV